MGNIASWLCAVVLAQPAAVAPEGPTPAESATPTSDRIFAGLHVEAGGYSSADVNDEINAALPDNTITSQGFQESVLLLGFGVNLEYRLSRYLAFGPYVSYIFAPKIVEIQQPDGVTTDSRFFNAHAWTPGGRVRGFLPVSDILSIVAGGGAAWYLTGFEDHSGSAWGYTVDAGVELVAEPGAPSARAMGYFRHAAIETDPGFTVDFTGGGILGEVLFGML